MKKNKKIRKRVHAFIGSVSTYNVEILNYFNPELKLKDTESAIKSKLIELLTQLKGFKFVAILCLVFKHIDSKNKTKYDNFYSSSNAEIIIIESYIDDVFKSIDTTIITNIQKSLEKGSGWVINSVINHTVSISKYNFLAGSSYIKLSKELDRPRKGLFNIQNIDDNEWFKWCLIKYLNPADHNPRRITKSDKEFAKRLNFKDIKFPVKIRDIRKIEKKNSINISVFGYENKEKHPIHVSKKCCQEKHVDLLLIEETEKKHYVLIKDFNTFLNDHLLHRERKHVCRYCLRAFITEEILK